MLESNNSYLTVTLTQISVFLPGKSPNKKLTDGIIRYHEHHSYTESYSIIFLLNSGYCQTERFHDHNLFLSLKSYVKSYGSKSLTIKVSKTTKPHIFKLHDIIFPDDFPVPHYFEIHEFHPESIKTRSCTKETFDYLYSSYVRFISDPANVIKFMDINFDGMILHNLDFDLDSNSYSTPFIELTSKDVTTIKNAILNNTPLKGMFSFNENNISLLYLT